MSELDQAPATTRRGIGIVAWLGAIWALLSGAAVLIVTIPLVSDPFGALLIFVVAVLGLPSVAVGLATALVASALHRRRRLGALAPAGLALFMIAAGALLLWSPTRELAAHWREAGAIVAKTALTATGQNEPLSVTEKAIIVAEFEQTWGKHDFPCNAVGVVRLFRHFSGIERARQMSVSLAVTRQLEIQWSGHAERHIRQPLVACHLEERYTDKALLRAWLADAYFGKRAYGIEAAARAYFGKDLEELELEEAARLATVLRNPNYYGSDEDRWAARATEIADRVVQMGDQLD